MVFVELSSLVEASGMNPCLPAAGSRSKYCPLIGHSYCVVTLKNSTTTTFSLVSCLRANYQFLNRYCNNP